MKYVLFSTLPNILGYLGMIFPHEKDIISRLMFPHKYISVGLTPPIGNGDRSGILSGYITKKFLWG